VRALCAQFPDEYFRKVDAERAYPEAFVEALTRAGWLSALIPEAYGGAGLSLTEACVIMEEINRAGGNAGACHGQMYVMGAVVRHGTEAQKQALLPRIAAGEVRLQSMAVTEPGAGSDTTRLQTTAVRRGDRYVVHGQKVWTSRVQHSDFMILLARTTPLAEVARKADGLSVFLVDLRESVGRGPDHQRRAEGAGTDQQRAPEPGQDHHSPGAAGASVRRNIRDLCRRSQPMPTDPILLEAGRWLGMASGLLFVVMLLGFRLGWGIRFRLVGVTSFTTLLAISCVAFAISYSPRVVVPGAVSVPVVFDNGGDLVIATAPVGLNDEAVTPSLEQVARNLRGSGRATRDGLVTVRLRRIEPVADGTDRPRVLAEVRRNLQNGELLPPL
jgi:hypothetical protein